jgi:hypothetical protein
MFKLRLDLTLSPVQLLSAAAVHPHPTLTSTCLDQASAQSCLMSFPLTTVPSNDSAFSDTLPTFSAILRRTADAHCLVTKQTPIRIKHDSSMTGRFCSPRFMVHIFLQNMHSVDVHIYAHKNATASDEQLAKGLLCDVAWTATVM